MKSLQLRRSRCKVLTMEYKTPLRQYSTVQNAYVCLACHNKSFTGQTNKVFAVQYCTLQYCTLQYCTLQCHSKHLQGSESQHSPTGIRESTFSYRVQRVNILLQGSESQHSPTEGSESQHYPTWIRESTFHYREQRVNITIQ